MNKMKFSILAGVICAAVCCGAAGEEPAPAFPGFVRAMELLRERGIITMTNGLENALLKNLLQAADPGGRLLDGNALSRLESDARGVWCVPDIHFVKTNKAAVVTEPLPEGFEPGDVLEMIEGKGVADLPAEDVLRLMAGSCEAKVRVTVRRGGSTEHELLVKRTEKPVPPFAAAEKIGPETGYMKLYGCCQGTADALEPLLLAWKTSGVYGVVLDLRSAGGWSLEDACRMAGFFAGAKRDLFSMVSPEGEPEVCAAAGGARLGMPLMVLVDKNTTGAAELLAAALQSGETGSMILGGETAGDFMLRESLRLNDEISLHVATRKLKLPDDRVCEANRGLIPDIVVEPRKGKAVDTPDEKTHPRLRQDAALQRACDVLQGLRALKIEFREESETPES